MNTPELTALIVALTGLAGAVGGVLAVVMRQTAETKSLHRAVNSRMTEMLALTRSAARAEGIMHERDSTRTLTSATPPPPIPPRITQNVPPEAGGPQKGRRRRG